MAHIALAWFIIFGKPSLLCAERILTLAEGRTLLPLLALVCFGSRYLRVGVRIVALSRQRSAQNDSHEDALTV